MAGSGLPENIDTNRRHVAAQNVTACGGLAKVFASVGGFLGRSRPPIGIFSRPSPDTSEARTDYQQGLPCSPSLIVAAACPTYQGSAREAVKRPGGMRKP